VAVLSLEDAGEQGKSGIRFEEKVKDNGERDGDGAGGCRTGFFHRALGFK
jgi:hypothetical protein